MEYKLCRDCKWIKLATCHNDISGFFVKKSVPTESSYNYAKCSNPGNGRIDKDYLVSGIFKESFCTMVRDKYYKEFYKCGADGNLWEPK